MRTLNRATIIGYVGQNPMSRITEGRKKIVTFSVSTNSSFFNKNTGQYEQRSEWHNVVVLLQSLAEIAEKHVKKGTRVMIEGAMQKRRWFDKSNVEKFSFEIVLQNSQSTLILLGRPNSEQDYSEDNDFKGENFGMSSKHDTESASASDSSSDFDDDIPF